MVTQRTAQQRKAIELYCKRVAQAMNDAGHSVQEVFTAPVDLSQENIKDGMFKAVQRALFPNKIHDDGTVSTTDLDTEEVNEVYENMHRIVAERYGINVEFPSIESMYNESQQRFNKP